jgi:RHS repeat-associated protein
MKSKCRRVIEAAAEGRTKLRQVDAGSGNVVASYLFDGYGVRKVASSDPTAPQDPYSGYGGLAGYYADWETGLCLLGFRYYDVLAGRFLTRDPIGFEGGINLYEYVGNCPTMNQDSAGLVNWKCLINLPGWVTNLLMKCSTAIIKLIHHDKSAWCAVASACVLGTACSSIVKCTLSLQLANGTLIILSCVIGALCSLVGSVISEICEAGGCPEKWWKWVEQNAICLIINAAVSCAVNVLGGILGGAIEVGGQTYDLPSWVRTYIMAHLAFLGFGINMTCSAAATGAAH